MTDIGPAGTAPSSQGLRLIVEMVPVSEEEAESLEWRQLAAIRRFLIRLGEVRDSGVSPPGGNLDPVSEDQEEVDR